jgi:hypothetical protein
MNTETTGAENTIKEKESPRKPGRQPLIIMISTINLIRHQSDLKTMSNKIRSSEMHDMEPVS